MSTPTLQEQINASKLSNEQVEYINTHEEEILPMFNLNPLRSLQDYIIKHKAIKGVKLEKTHVHDTFYRNLHGHSYNTEVTDTKGRTWKLNTCKTYGGNVNSDATEILKESFGETASSQRIDIHNSIDLIDNKIRATKKAVASQHKEAIELFLEKLKESDKENK